MTDLEFALKMYGEALVDYYKDANNYDNLCFWEEQVNTLAKELAQS